MPQCAKVQKYIMVKTGLQFFDNAWTVKIGEDPGSGPWGPLP